MSLGGSLGEPQLPPLTSAPQADPSRQAENERIHEFIRPTCSQTLLPGLDRPGSQWYFNGHFCSEMTPRPAASSTA